MNPFEFAVSLRTFSIDVVPAEICAQLGLTPKWMRRIGEPRTNPAGLVLGGVYDESYCSFPIERKTDEDLADLLERVTEGLVRHADLFLRISAGGGRSEFFIGWYSIGNTGSTFGSSLLKRLGDLGIDLALDVYGEPVPETNSAESLAGYSGTDHENSRRGQVSHVTAAVQWEI